MATDKVIDRLVEAAPEWKGVILTRDAVVDKWCREHGKQKDALSCEDILAIRALPEWKNAGKQ